MKNGLSLYGRHIFVILFFCMHELISRFYFRRRHSDLEAFSRSIWSMFLHSTAGNGIQLFYCLIFRGVLNKNYALCHFRNCFLELLESALMPRLPTCLPACPIYRSIRSLKKKKSIQSICRKNVVAWAGSTALPPPYPVCQRFLARGQDWSALDWRRRRVSEWRNGMFYCSSFKIGEINRS